ncbi:Protein DMP4 [Linum grandiflorum]
MPISRTKMPTLKSASNSMEIKVVEKDGKDETCRPLLSAAPDNDEDNKTAIQQAISQTFKSTAHLANLLPTGTVLAFQLLSPVFSNQGQCDSVGRYMTTLLVTLCGLSCILSSFTDSFTDKNGAVSYGIATLNGLWVIDGTGTIPPELARAYKLSCLDFVHALMSMLLFVAVALFDDNVVSCFYPTPSTEIQEILTAAPIGIGVICSMLFVLFPTKRHGIGFLSRPASETTPCV